MLKKAKIWIAYQFLRTVYCRDASAFGRALSCVRDAQHQILFNILHDNRQTEIGKKYRFSSIKDVSAYKRLVPVLTYEDYAQYVERIALGEKSLLTREPVLVLEPSSGSTAPSKYIPYTRSLRKEYHRALAPWIYDLITCYPRIIKGSAYWSITPVTHDTKAISGMIPIGFKDDSEYFGRFARYWIRKIFAVPKEVCELKDITVFRYVTILFLLKDKNLSLISIWNPSFLVLLLEPLWKWRGMLIRDIESGTITSTMKIAPDLKKRLVRCLSPDSNRAHELKRIFDLRLGMAGKQDSTGSLYKQIWPNLSLISCWVDGNAALYLSQLKNCFPDVEIQPKGLIATEAIVSIPLHGEKAGVLAVNSHFFEFIELSLGVQIDKGPIETKLAHELIIGKQYSVIVTTGGGLYRYHMQDCIKVVDFLKQCPIIVFVGKSDKIVDICGEKLNEQFVASVLDEVFNKYRIRPTFFMIAPHLDVPHCCYRYNLFLQLHNEQAVTNDTLEELNAEVELKMRMNFHYDYCRKLGQLQSLRIFLIPSDFCAILKYLQCRNQEGQRLGSIKPAILDKGINWHEIFGGSFINECSSLSRI